MARTPSERKRGNSSPGTNAIQSSDGRVESEVTIKGKGRVSPPPVVSAAVKQPNQPNFGKILSVSHVPTPIIEGSQATITVLLEDGASGDGLNGQFRHVYSTGSGKATSINTSPYRSFTFSGRTAAFAFDCPTDINDKSILEIRTTFNKRIIDNTQHNLVTTDQPVAPSFNTTPTLDYTLPIVGTTISVNPFTVSGNPTPSIAYQWYLDSSPIIGETTDSYTVTSAGLVSVEITLQNNLGTATATATATAGIAASFNGTPTPSATDVVVGTTVGVNGVNTSGTTPVTTSYVWKLNNSVISGANSQSYTTVNTGNLTCIVTVANNYGNASRTINFGTVGVAPAFYVGDLSPIFPNPQLNNQVGDFVDVRGIYYNGVPVPGATATVTDSIGSRTVDASIVDTAGGNKTEQFVIRNTSDIYVTIDIANIHGSGTTSPHNYISGNPAIFENIQPANAAASFTGTPTASPASSGITLGTQVSIIDAGATGWPVPSTNYEWTQNGSVISGAVSQSYTPSATGPLSGKVTIDNSAGPPASVTLSFGTILPANAPGPVNAPASFTGTPTASASSGVTVGSQVSIVDAGATGWPVPSTDYEWTQNGSVIGGANSQSYTPLTTGPLSGKVTIDNTSGPSTSATLSFGTVVPANAAASFTGTPTASASSGVTVGSQVSVIDAGATGWPVPSTTYEWTQNGSVISGANSSTYTPLTTGPLSGEVTIDNTSGPSTSATLNFGTVVPANAPASFTGRATASPSSTGITVGTQVSVIDAGATGWPVPSTTYEWTQNGSVISGAIGQSYTPSVTGPLSSTVTIDNTSGPSVNAVVDFGTILPANAANVAPSFDNPQPTANFAIDAIEVNQVARVTNINVSGVPGPTTSYQWRTVPNVLGASTNVGTGETYTVASADEGKDLECDVTLSNGVSPDATVTVDFGTVQAASPTGTAPSFLLPPVGSTTNPDVGERMTFLDYGSTGTAPITTSFQWYDDGAAISGATGYGYVLGATGELTDATKTIIVTVVNAGSGNRFHFDGVSNPANYPMTRGVEYIFDQTDSSNSNHPLVLKNLGSDYPWTTDTNPGGGIGNGIGVRTLIVPADAPASLTYVCGVHGAGMGNSIDVTTVPAADVTMTGNLTGVVTLTNSEGSTSATVDYGTMLNADITNLSLSNVVAGATLTATVTYGGTFSSIAWSGVTS